MLSVLEIGEKIAVARKLRNLSQAQLAESLAVTAQAVGKWERGESMPDILTFGRLADTLGVDLNYFGGGQDHPPLAGPPPQPDTPQREPKQKRRWNMSGGNWSNADFSGLGGLAEKFSRANIEKCLFVGSELSGLVLKGNNIEHCDFTRSHLRGCTISGANLEHDSFAGCDFTGSGFTRSNVENCDFSGANLTGVLFKWSNLGKLQLHGAVLSETAFQMGQLTDLLFDGEITDCAFENCDFARVEFNGAVIRNTFFKNSKLRRAKFIDCRADKLSYAFMKTCKADLSDVAVLEEA